MSRTRERVATVPVSLLLKLGSLVIHGERFLNRGALTEITQSILSFRELRQDPEVVTWLNEMGGALPLPAKEKTDGKEVGEVS